MIAHAEQTPEPDKDRAAALLRALIAAADELGLNLTPRLLLSTEEAAQSLGISSKFLGDLAICGDVDSVCIGARRMFRPGDLQRWVEAGCPHERWSARALERRQAAPVSSPKRSRKGATAEA